jgi:2-iminobutanoate/2-iminopropanoate deaminase
MKFIQTDNAPLPGGHYSQAVVAGGLIFVAGQLPFDPARPGHLDDDVGAQAAQALENVRHVLEAAGASMQHIVNAMIFVTDIANWPEVNRVYAQALGEHRPARTVAVSSQLHYGALVEVQVTALLPR